MKTPGMGPLSLSAIVAVCHAANWAQISGPISQPHTRVTGTAWEPRWGFAAAALDLTPEEAAATKSLPKIFIFGGETFNVTGGSGGMKNDVYSTTGAKWLVYENFMGYNKNGDFEPRVVSQTKWTQVIAGRSPPPFVSYRYWTSCVAEGIPWRSTDRPNCDVIWREPALYKPDLMWSPRRSHAAISFLGELYIMGGRAREGEDIRELASIGSIYTPEAINVTTVHRTTAKNRDEVVWRERVVLKNDVWKSKDGGSNWELLNPGCMSSTPQTTRKAGLSDSQFNNAGGGVQCFTSDQCFGDADCSFGKCICKIWDARERHTAVVFGAPRPFIYVLGGFIERELQTCGKETTSSTHGRKSGEEYACGGQYRGYMPDVWRSLDGIKWQLMKSKAWPGRGEHVSWVLDGILFVAGGRTGHSWKKEESYLNDVWLTQDGYMWTQMMEHAEWEPRGNLEAVVVPKSSLARMSTVHIFGGAGGVAGKETYFNDMWTWHSIAGEPWAQDYNNYTFSYKYVRDDSPIDMLRLRVPMDVMSAADVLKLQALGVNTINELANLPVDVAVELRTALNNKGVANVCEQKDLARAIVRKCASPAPEHDQVQSEIQDIPIGKYYGEDATRFKYYNERPKRILLNETTRAAKRREEEADPWEEEVEGWDGCTQIGIKVLDPYTGGSVYADIDGIPQVQSVQPTWRIEEELICQQVFTPREYMRGLMFQDMMYAFGGRTKRDNDPDVGSWGAQVYHNDVWYRDGVLPVSSFTLKPDSYSSQLSFKFEADEQGCIFEWRLNDWSENRVEMNWTKSAGRLTITWLELGWHRLRLRGIDPAGNVEELFEEGRNQHTWYYVPPLPLLLILCIIAGIFVIGTGVFIEWRRRRRKAAMERYAIKRMRRKFKGVQAKAKTKEVDWKKYGKEAKKAAKGHKAGGGEKKHKHTAKAKASGAKGAKGAGGAGGAQHKKKKTH